MPSLVCFAGRELTARSNGSSSPRTSPTSTTPSSAPSSPSSTATAPSSPSTATSTSPSTSSTAAGRPTTSASSTAFPNRCVSRSSPPPPPPSELTIVFLGGDLVDVRGPGVPRPERAEPADPDGQPVDAPDDGERRPVRVPEQPRAVLKYTRIPGPRGAVFFLNKLRVFLAGRKWLFFAYARRGSDRCIEWSPELAFVTHHSLAGKRIERVKVEGLSVDELFRRRAGSKGPPPPPLYRTHPTRARNEGRCGGSFPSRSKTQLETEQSEVCYSQICEDRIPTSSILCCLSIRARRATRPPREK